MILETSLFVTQSKYACQQTRKFVCMIPLMEKYSERLTWAINNAGITQTDLARMIGVKPQTIQYLCSPKNNAQGSIHNASIAEILKISALWLETGRGDISIQPSKAERMLEMLGIDIKRNDLDMEGIEILRDAIQVPKENRKHLKKIVKTFSEPDSDGEEQGSGG